MTTSHDRENRFGRTTEQTTDYEGEQEVKSYRRIGAALAALTVLLTVMTAAPGQAGKNLTWSTSDVAAFADPGTRIGTSHLIRTRWGVHGTFRTSELPSREALTLWWVVFNNPQGCSDPCGEDDIFVNGDPTEGLNAAGIAAADIVAAYADGVVGNKNGRAFMSAWLSQGALVSEIIFGVGPTLKDAHAAEVHLVARSHGPAIPGMIKVQTGSYAGGCEVFLNPPEVPDAEGECADIHFAVHLP